MPLGLITILAALAPEIARIIDLFVKTPEEKKQDFLNDIPVKLREMHDAFLQEYKDKDPSAVNRILNGS